MLEQGKHDGQAVSRLLADLRVRLSEAEETLGAIRSGEIDALLIDGPEGLKTYTLTGADRPYRIMVEQMVEGAASVASDGTVLYANQRLADLCQRSLEDLVGHLLQQYFVPEDEAKLIEVLQHEAGRQEPAIHLSMRQQDAEPLPVSVSASTYTVDGGNVHCLIVTDITLLKREERLMEFNRVLEERVANRTAEADRRARQLQALAGQLSRVEQQERKRIAQMLHDGLQQILVASKMRLASLLPKAENEKLRQGMHQVMNLIGDSIRSSRSLTVELTPPILFEEGLGPALEWVARHFESEHGLAVKVHASSPEYPIDEDVRTFLFHAVRELLFNTVKYAKVPDAEVLLEFPDESWVRVTVRDRGAGAEADPTRVFDNSGFGLFSIQQRAELFGGNLSVKTSPGEGFAAVLSAPTLEASPDEAADEGQNSPVIDKTRLVRANGKSDIPRLRVLLVDDHKVLRDGLSMLLISQPDIQLIGDAGDGATAIRLAHELKPDVIVMDISMPGINGIQATRRIHAELPSIRIIGLSMHEAENVASAMMDAGAECYLPKDGAADQLIQAIRG